MVSMTALWMPILVSAVIVFIASSVMHMMLSYHQTDYRQVPNEDKILAALQPFNIPPGDYFVPHGEGMSALKDPAYLAKINAGPVAIMTVRPNGPPAMGKSLVLWFLYAVVVSGMAAYVAGRVLEPGADYLAAFRFAGTTAFAAYAMAHLQESIWTGRAWSTTVKNVFDGLVYALLTGGVFGWLWPSA